MQHLISFHPSGDEGQGPINVVSCNCVMWQAAVLYLAGMKDKRHLQGERPRFPDTSR